MENSASHREIYQLASGISPKMARLIKEGDTSVSAQFLASKKELVFWPEESADPIGDLANSPIKGIVHRYPDRVLLTATYLCGVYCRFCFRREQVGRPTNNLSSSEWENALKYIEEHEQIFEVILTGGDPFVLSDAKLESLLSRLEAIDHLKVIRFHSRMPSVQPQRFSKRLLSRLRALRKTVFVVVHVNSPSEVDAEFSDLARELRFAGVSLLAQTVLLKGINDTVEALKNLFRRLVAAGVKPYYLHYPDLARGTNHFRIPLHEAVQIVSELRGHISGLAIPQLMVDIPGGLGKVPIEKNWYRNLGGNSVELLSPITKQWVQVVYPPVVESIRQKE